MRVWVVTIERGYAGYWGLQGVHSSLELARAWVERQRAGHGLAPREWTLIRDGEVWLCDDYCLYRATVDSAIE